AHAAISTPSLHDALPISKDAREAFGWYRKAAELGHLPAVNQVGYCYQQGIGVAKDAKEAVRWFERAAAQKYPAALLCLGHCLLRSEEHTSELQSRSDLVC